MFQLRWDPVPIEGPVKERLGTEVELRVSRSEKKVENLKTYR